MKEFGALKERDGLLSQADMLTFAADSKMIMTGTTTTATSENNIHKAFGALRQSQPVPLSSRPKKKKNDIDHHDVDNNHNIMQQHQQHTDKSKDGLECENDDDDDDDDSGGAVSQEVLLAIALQKSKRRQMEKGTMDVSGSNHNKNITHLIGRALLSPQTPRKEKVDTTTITAATTLPLLSGLPHTNTAPFSPRLPSTGKTTKQKVNLMLSSASEHSPLSNNNQWKLSHDDNNHHSHHNNGNSLVDRFSGMFSSTLLASPTTTTKTTKSILLTTDNGGGGGLGGSMRSLFSGGGGSMHSGNSIHQRRRSPISPLSVPSTSKGKAMFGTTINLASFHASEDSDNEQDYNKCHQPRRGTTAGGVIQRQGKSSNNDHNDYDDDDDDDNGGSFHHDDDDDDEVEEEQQQEAEEVPKSPSVRMMTTSKPSVDNSPPQPPNLTSMTLSDDGTTVSLSSSRSTFLSSMGQLPFGNDNNGKDDDDK